MCARAPPPRRIRRKSATWHFFCVRLFFLSSAGVGLPSPTVILLRPRALYIQAHNRNEAIGTMGRLDSYSNTLSHTLPTVPYRAPL